jgi:large subunit ribosomal protein L25
MSAITKLATRKRPFCQTKGELNELRKSGLIPAIIYGGGKDPQGLSIEAKEFSKELSTPGIKARVFKLDDKIRTLVRQIQFNPVTDKPVHVDFYRLTEGSRVIVIVPIQFINEEKSPGLKKGGVLNTILHSIELSVMAQDIPEKLTIDLSGIEIGNSLHVKDLSLPKGVKPHKAQDKDTIVTIVAPSGLIASSSESSEEENKS